MPHYPTTALSSAELSHGNYATRCVARTRSQCDVSASLRQQLPLDLQTRAVCAACANCSLVPSHAADAIAASTLGDRVIVAVWSSAPLCAITGVGSLSEAAE